jgi:hypothetical protein
MVSSPSPLAPQASAHPNACLLGHDRIDGDVELAVLTTLDGRVDAQLLVDCFGKLHRRASSRVAGHAGDDFHIHVNASRSVPA